MPWSAWVPWPIGWLPLGVSEHNSCYRLCIARLDVSCGAAHTSAGVWLRGSSKQYQMLLVSAFNGIQGNAVIKCCQRAAVSHSQGQQVKVGDLVVAIHP